MSTRRTDPGEALGQTRLTSGQVRPGTVGSLGPRRRLESLTMLRRVENVEAFHQRGFLGNLTGNGHVALRVGRKTLTVSAKSSLTARTLRR